MFKNEKLQEHLETSSVIKINSAVIAEWNMNIAENISRVGNYRYRPNDPESPEFNFITQSFSENDEVNRFYTDATDADVLVDGGVENDGTPIAFVSKKEKEKLLFSLEDCFGRFRPRSGINKLRYFDNRFTHFANTEMTRRPRYYISDKEDVFKYWTSYRTEDGTERGIANINLNDQNFIQDAAPFVVYKKPVPANRIVVKMQTGVGDIDLGPFITADSFTEDPFFGKQNQTTPINWKIQILDESDSWVDAATFDSNSVRKDGTEVIQENGYVELQYGLIVPEVYERGFEIVSTYSSQNLLPDPENLPNGTAYLIKENEDDPGLVFVVLNNADMSFGFYEFFLAQYGWKLENEDVASSTSFVYELTSPPSFIDRSTGARTFREFSYVKGLRVVVETMNVFDSTFDLIELSPRLSVNISDKVSKFSLSKTASDLGLAGLPVGQLLASVGTLDIFDYDQSFFPENKKSIISQYTSKNIQFRFYEIVKEVSGEDFYVPIKTMYSEGFPTQSSNDRQVGIQLRDLFFYFESLTAPQIFITGVSVSSAVATLLDSIGFSNYTFFRNPGESEDIIPYFFVEPDKTIALVLQDIATSTQSAMFFDEFNNFIVASRNYILPNEEERETDMILRGSQDFQKENSLKNAKSQDKLANIVDVSFESNEIFNAGSIVYSTRSIQRSYGSIRQASLIDVEKTWIYKPVLLWEVDANEATKPINDEVEDQSAFALTAIPLNSDLSDKPPSVVNGKIINNIMDLGDGVYWTARYNGYFYANGEIIKYDAIQFSIPGLSDIDQDNPNVEGDNVWITNVKEYQKYFAKLPFNGKIYPTGLVRIYSEPNFQVVGGVTRLKNGPVAKHGRSQFGTGTLVLKENEQTGIKTLIASPVFHHAGLSEYWSDSNNWRGCSMDFKYMFNEEVRRLKYQDVSVKSNEEFAVLNVPNATTARVGNIVTRIALDDDQPVTNIIPQKTIVTSIDIEENTITLSKALTNLDDQEFFDVFLIDQAPETEVGPAGVGLLTYKNASVSGLIKNIFRNQFLEETSNRLTYPATVQSSALVIKGNVIDTTDRPTDFLTYIPKKLDDRFKHFGTRVRIIGKIENNEFRGQTAEGSSAYFTNQNSLPGQAPSLSGGSGGIAIMVNPETNNGYYFEIAALSENDLDSYSVQNDTGAFDVNNIFFYKISKNKDAVLGSSKAIPKKLFGGVGAIRVDDGLFTGQSRLSADESVTVYDLAVEYEDVEGIRNFYLYVNNVLVGIAQDDDPLPIVNSMAVFVRGNAKLMFENIYALAENYSQNTAFSIDAPINSSFGNIDLNANSSFTRYAVSGLIQSTYLSGVSALEPPKYKIYFEEFGTIMREASYFDVRYDKAYPALSAQISPTFSRVKGFTVAGFTASAYGAEFLVFNHTDTVLNLDSTSGNYLRIQGVTFTQQSQNELTVDDYFQKKSSSSNLIFTEEGAVESPIDAKKNYIDIKLSRLTQGQKDFSIDAPYIQNQDTADDLMKWLVEKIMKPRKSVGLQVFGLPTLQLGDIVEIDYASDISENGFNEISARGKRFVVYNMEYIRAEKEIQSRVFLSEVSA
jgi:hypothetical protein